MKAGDLVRYINVWHRPWKRQNKKLGLVLEFYHPFYKILWNDGIISKYTHYTYVEVISERCQDNKKRQ